MNPVTLVTIIVSGAYVHKTVVNTENGTGAFVKGEDLLPNWVISTGTQCDNPAEGSVQDMIKNWEDGHNAVFSFQPDTKEEVFKKSKICACIQNMPKFNAVNSSNLTHTLSASLFVMTPICLALEVVLKQLPAGVMKCVGAQLIEFFNDYKQNSNLLGHDLWDAHFRKLMSVELQFYHQKRNTILNKLSY